MTHLGPAKLAAKPPILDSSVYSAGGSNDEFHSHQDAIHGLRALREAVKRDLDVLEKFLDGPASSAMPSLSTNAPYLVAVWNGPRAAERQRGGYAVHEEVSSARA
ncbi:hypothetical protein NUW54_g10495 [Trametes sanguinea]|uniref:Uncharacterized protein n=1 Tax=Trametes sanguinea TaxID=158606 RepID=A0ACC1NZ90_9APHY|nr:hypothetical protein NUW54_g10495 [Trametes sanguinea]